MRASRAALKASSSQRWLARQARDPFVLSAAEGGYRARSAFKLLDLASKYPAIRGHKVVDLGGAPGGWSQVAAKWHRGDHVVAVDLLPIEPIRGVHVVQGDFFDAAVRDRVQGLLGGRADTVLSDMMAAMSGVRVRDVQASLDLVGAATGFAHQVLRPQDGERAGGSLVLKFFHHPDLMAFRKESLDPWFDKVVTDKPKSSRKESSEAYWVCLGYKGQS